MTTKLTHLFGREDVYIIRVLHGLDEGRPSWQYNGWHLHHPKVSASVEANLFGRHGFGVGWKFGRNGGESDVGLDIYLGRLASVWLRFGSPWTKWLRINDRREGWYLARHTGIRLFPHKGCLLRVEVDNPEHGHGKREWSLTRTTIWGRHRSETVEGDSGVTRVPMPEGNYHAVWTEKTYVRRHVRFPGTLRDRITGHKTSRYITLDIPGGIPVEGKGENSWDCGMDGVMGVSGATLEEAVSNAVRSVLRDRQRYGGPHDLDRPMTIAEAEARSRQ